MGRHSTGAETCEGSKRIDLSFLLKLKHFQKDRSISGTIKWTDKHGGDCGNIHIISYHTDEEKYLQLKYTLTDHRTQQKIDYDYKIMLTSVPSNLGKGEVLYFLCPETGKRCKILYMAYGSHKWKSRAAYPHRIYYDSQTSAKKSIENDRYWAITKRLEKLEGQRYQKLTYKGQPTKRALLLERLRKEQAYYDRVRWGLHNFPLSLQRSLKRELGRSG